MGKKARQIRVGLMAIFSMVLAVPQPLFALGTVVSTPPLVDGPFLITAYSFSGHNIRYVQITNNDDTVESLDGWKVRASWGSGLWQSQDLSGLVAPNKKVTVANESLLPTATFPFTQTEIASDPRIETISLIAPVGNGLLDSVEGVSIKDSGSSATARDESTTPSTFFFERNRSSSTGSYLSSFTALAIEPLAIESDPLYSPVDVNPLQIVEAYPNAVECSPVDDGPLCHDYVKVYNASQEAIELGGFRIRTGAVSNGNTAYPSGRLASGAYAIVNLSLSGNGGYTWIEDVHGLMAYEDSVVDFPSSSGRDGMAWSYNISSGNWQWTKYPTPGDEPNSFGPNGVVNDCSGLRLSEIGANYSPQFIEVENYSSATMDLSGCQLQTNRSLVDSYVFADGTKLPAGGLAAISVEKTDLSLTKTTSGTVYILSSDGSTEVDVRSYDSLDDNTSFALVGGKWMQTFVATPGNTNQYQEYPACQAGYSRSALTGRCNKDPEPTALTPCGPGQYRSPDTNRCRSIVTTASMLSSCGPGEYRNPETNRCKKIQSAESSLKPCSDGYERNPETNRCRKVLAASTAIPSAGFPVESVGDSARVFTAWWALGGVLFLGLGYAGWEWRYEISGWLKRASSKSKS